MAAPMRCSEALLRLTDIERVFGTLKLTPAKPIEFQIRVGHVVEASLLGFLARSVDHSGSRNLSAQSCFASGRDPIAGARVPSYNPPFRDHLQNTAVPRRA
jgi:hypothetical protein